MKSSYYRGKRALKRWEHDRQVDGQQQRLKSIRPLSHDFDWDPPILNQGKKLMQQQDKFTEIQRQNRYLLQKIATTMRKKSDRQSQKQRMNKSLNAPFRRRQLESIEVQNARLLKKLQDRKSDYNAKKLKQDWKKQKEVIKNIAFYPFIIKTSMRGGKRRTISVQKPEMNHSGIRNHALSSDIEMVRARTLQGEGFVITIRIDDQMLRITGQRRKTKQKKLIDIPKEEAMVFIDQQCQGKIEGIFDRLSFDTKEDVLYLIGHSGQNHLTTIRQNRAQLQQQTQRQVIEEGTIEQGTV